MEDWYVRKGEYVQTSYVLSTIAQLFVKQERDAYKELTSETSWSQFLHLAQESGAETNLIVTPLSFEEHTQFCRKHFTGGLPASALPIESLYPANTSHVSQSPLCQPAQCGTYMGSSAHYMQELILALGLNLPSQFNACPDHLSLECDLAAFLQDSGQVQNSAEFMAERFLWLTAYKERLMELHDDSKLFFVGLINILLTSTTPHTQA